MKSKKEIEKRLKYLKKQKDLTLTEIGEHMCQQSIDELEWILQVRHLKVEVES